MMIATASGLIGASPLPAGIVLRQDRRVEAGALQDSENLLGADRGRPASQLPEGHGSGQRGECRDLMAVPNFPLSLAA